MQFALTLYVCISFKLITMVLVYMMVVFWVFVLFNVLELVSGMNPLNITKSQ
jgi:hypothetical protein